MRLSPAMAMLALLAAAVAVPGSAFQPARSLHTSAVRARPPALRVATSPDTDSDTGTGTGTGSVAGAAPKPPIFNKVMAANRAEIAVRIMRACIELNTATVAIYGHEDRYSQHRWGADQSFLMEKADDATPISAYLDIEQIIATAKRSGVDAIHPGYGFLSESPEFAQACSDAGITFVGPTVENLNTFSDKTSARKAAIAADVPVVPGSAGALNSAEEVQDFVDEYGVPVIIKAAMGGGGKGMRVIRDEADVASMFDSASSEALASFGDGSVFVEKYIERPRHIEVQILGDGTGDVVHLYERDCSIQRRHQKVIEMAPGWSLPDELRAQLHKYATDLTGAANYKNAGTVEFLVDTDDMKAYFIEVNPRVQVEHTVTEEVTGVDIVKAQLRIAAGATLKEQGLVQENISARGVAIQCRVTTENPEKDFAPDTGTISVYRHSAGCGIRMDGIGYSGLTVTPYYDSMLVKYTARGSDFGETVARMKRVLQECRIRGVKTNIPFLLNVLTHPEFETGIVTTSFIDDNPELKQISTSTWDFASKSQSDQRKVGSLDRALRYLANLAVNGHPDELGADVNKLSNDHTDPTRKILPLEVPRPEDGGMRKILLEEGPEGYAKFVRENSSLMITDTTWRDAHQSLLATRMRTSDLVRCATYTNKALSKAFSLEMWGGATFDVSMRFLNECPWERLEELRAKVPDVPFQMLLRGANAVGYTNYPDNVVYEFCKKAHESGIDIFRVFDSLNYVENMELGIKAAAASGGFVEAAMSYTGDVADETKGKYNLDYYLDLAQKLVDLGAHSLAIKDMAGLLTPRASTMLVSALRKAHPDTPIHVHTHDTAGAGVASMLAAAEAGADIVDASIDGMSGLTAQPSLGAIVANVRGTDKDTGIDIGEIAPLNTYWEEVRQLYSPFESGQLSGSSDVYVHEIPGGQYTNLLFQSRQLGLTEKWPQIKKKYAEANVILGDIPKVTPSSKVVGDLAQFMVAQDLEIKDVAAQADTLAFPESVVQYLRGEIGIPPGGFPEPLRSAVLKARGLDPIEGRPGASMDDYDFVEAKALLASKYPDISDKDVLSHALYPNVFIDFKNFASIYGDVRPLPTHLFLNPLKEGDESEINFGFGDKALIKLTSMGQVNEDGTRNVIFDVNGERWFAPVTDQSEEVAGARREKATDPGDVGSPMPGVVVGLKVEVGDVVTEGEPVATLSAMKMETNIPATASGKVTNIMVNIGDKLDGDDLIMKIED